MQFPVVKLLDYQPRLAELETDPNPFALATVAQPASAIHWQAGSDPYLDEVHELE